MSHEDWLHTIAEVSIALAGFSGLAASLRDVGTRHALINRTRLLTIVETALSALFFSILPVLLHGLGVSEAGAFRISAFFFLMGFGPLCYRGFRRFLKASGTGRSELSRGLGFISLQGAVLSLAGGVLCVFGFPSGSISTLYLLAMVGLLTIGAANFGGFAETLIAVHSDEGDGADGDG